ncbi:MAG: hypothetical protein AB7I50_11885 [Vicinamibacterales bacterium]
MTASRGHTWTALWGLIVLLGAAAAILRPLNHDTGWYLYMADTFLHGGRLYVDVVDTNPPLIILFTIVPVAVANAVGVAPAWVFALTVFVLAFGSGVASLHLLRQAWPAATPAVHGLLGCSVLFLLLVAPAYDFGQREHLTVIATLPYVLAVVLHALHRTVKPGAGVAVGLAGALGFAIKPHFLVAWIAVEAALMGLRRTTRTLWRPEAFALLAIWILYALLAIAFFPEYFDVAGRVWQVYGALNAQASVLPGLRELQVAAVLLAIVALLRLPREYHAPLAIVTAAACGFLAASLLQLKGWGYQMLPPRVYLALLVVLIVAGLLQAMPALAGRLRLGAAGVAGVIALSLTAISAKYVADARTGPLQDFVSPLAALVREHAPRGPIATLAMHTLVYPSFPLVNHTRAPWSLRHHSLWFLAAFYERELAAPWPDPVVLHARAAMSPLERQFYDEIISDLCRLPPRLLIVEAPSPLGPRGSRSLDLLAYYRQDPRVTRLLETYREIAVIAPFTVFKAEGTLDCSGGVAG